MTLIEVRVPDIGNFKDVGVIELLVKPGDTVKVEQSLITVESDKASMEIPSSLAGVIREMKIKLGDRVNQGDVIALLEGSSLPLPLAGEDRPQAGERTPSAAPSPVIPVKAGIQAAHPSSGDNHGPLDSRLRGNDEVFLPF
jgi:pyruvate dehydrogenase E2 component (dihydrolipoamide acetyltransferase)